MVKDQDIEQAINQIKYHKQDYEELLANEQKESIKIRLQGIIKNYDTAIKALEEMSESKSTTTVTYSGINMSGDCEYQCDDCGQLDVLSGFDYCPGCGKEIQYS